MNKKILITKITPLYNYYREHANNISGSEALEILWEIGNALRGFITEHDIAPHTLYRDIYGKSENANNVAKKSYLTREVLSRAYRIRGLFNNKKDIQSEFPSLKSFNLFKEAMPFLDNPKFKLCGTERRNLINELNSNKPTKEILIYIQKLQDQKIGIKNPRTQRLNELEEDVKVFVDFYNYIYRLLKLGNYAKVMNEDLSEIDIEYIKVLSKNTSALSQDGLMMFDFELPVDLDTIWSRYAGSVKTLISAKNAILRRRFRRLIPPVRMVRLADMLHALTSEEEYNGFQ